MLRELAERCGGGIVVGLLWDPGRDQVVLRYLDRRENEEFVVDVPNDDALTAFDHPNLYRPLPLAA